jgi:hypothetical protein
MLLRPMVRRAKRRQGNRFGEFDTRCSWSCLTNDLGALINADYFWILKVMI